MEEMLPQIFHGAFEAHPTADKVSRFAKTCPVSRDNPIPQVPCLLKRKENSSGSLDRRHLVSLRHRYFRARAREY